MLLHSIEFAVRAGADSCVYWYHEAIRLAWRFLSFDGVSKLQYRCESVRLRQCCCGVVGRGGYTQTQPRVENPGGTYEYIYSARLHGRLLCVSSVRTQ